MVERRHVREGHSKIRSSPPTVAWLSGAACRPQGRDADGRRSASAGMIDSYRMSKSAKIAFSLHPRLLDRVERVGARTGESRRAFIARALVAVTEEEARAADVQRYVEAYRQHPETPEDVLRRARARGGR